mgnify:CR=1 FL=1
MATYSILGGKVTLCGKHYKSTEDALWLTSFIHPKPFEQVLDVGAGNGAIGLTLNALHQAPVTLLEKDKELIGSLQTAAKLNTCRNVNILQETWPSHKLQSLYDYVVSNPPFHLLEQGFESQTKQEFHGISKEELMAWVHECYEVCSPLGTVTLFLSIKSFKALESLLTSLGLQAVTEVFSSAQKPAKACIVELSPAHTGETQYYRINTYDKAVREDVLRNGGKIKAHQLARS